VPGLAPIYFVVILLLSIVALVRLLWSRRRGTLHIERGSLQMLALSLAWAASITVGLLVLSIVTPAFYNRYLTASVPGLALFVATLTVISLTSAPSREVGSRRILWGASFLLVAVVLVANALWISGKVDENLKGTANFLASHVGSNGEVALPTHGLATGIEYYLPAHQSITTWPRSRGQEHLLGLDLLDAKRAVSMGRHNVWLVNDGSTNGLRPFTAALEHGGYVEVGSVTFGTLRPVVVTHFRRDHPAHA
jgi:hypothetical protein